MTAIGVFGEFFYGNNEMALRTFSETDYCDDEVVEFDSMEQLKAYIITLMKNPNAWPAMAAVAKLYIPNVCRKSFDECDQDYIDLICDKLYKGELVLIARKYHGIKDVRLEQCCVEVTIAINQKISNSAFLSSVIIALPFFKAFFYPDPKEKLASLASSAISVMQEDWNLLAEAIKGVNIITRRSIHDLAGIHAGKHQNNRKLKQLWEGVSDAFA